MSIPLCSINAGYAHSWRFVMQVVNDIRGGFSGMWQCNDCQRVEIGRPLTDVELKGRLAGQDVIVQTRESPR